MSEANTNEAGEAAAQAATPTPAEQIAELTAELAIVIEQRSAAGAAISELRKALESSKAAGIQANAEKLAAVSQCNEAHERAEELAEALRLLQAQAGEQAAQAISLPGDDIVSLAQCPDDRAATLVIAADLVMSALNMPAGTRLRSASAKLDISGARFAMLEICSPVLPALAEGEELPKVTAHYIQAMPGTPPVVSFQPI